jgi:uncharacterized membrane protein
MATPSEDPVLQRADAAAFLAVLLVGIGSAVLTGARFIPELMQNHPETMRGFFMGLVLVSVAAPVRHMREQRLRHLSIFLAVAATTASLLTLQTNQSSFASGEITLSRGAATPAEAMNIDPSMRWSLNDSGEDGKHGLTFRLLGEAPEWSSNAPSITVPVMATRAGSDGNLPPDQRLTFTNSPPSMADVSIRNEKPLQGGLNPSNAWIFACGAIAICAMILPGLSGSFLLLLLGQYDFILFQLHLLIHGADSAAGPRVAFFLAGITVGILSFSRLLHALLERAHDGTMAALAGLMIGSLYSLWPWQLMTAAGSTPAAPAEGQLLSPLLACVLGMALVGTFLMIDTPAATSGHEPAPTPDS